MKEKDDGFERIEEVEFKLIENVVEDLGDISGEALIMDKSVQTLAKAKLYV